MKNRYFKLILTLILSIAMLTPFFSTNVNAVENVVIDVPWSQPLADNENGYLELFVERNGQYYIQQIIWSIRPVEDVYNDMSVMDIHILTDNSIVFTASSLHGGNYFNLYRLYTGPNGSAIEIMESIQFSSLYNFTFTSLRDFNYNILGIRYYGNAGMISYDKSVNNQNYIVNYGGSEDIDYTTFNEMLNEIIKQGITLEEIKTQIEECYDYIKSIYDEIVITNSKLENMYTTIKNINANIINGFKNLQTKIETEFATFTSAFNEKLDLIKTIITNTANSIINVIGTQFNQMKVHMTELFNQYFKPNQDSIDNNENVQEEFIDKTEQLNEIEENIVNDFNTNINNINLNNNMFNTVTFKNSAIFLTNQIDRIYNMSATMRNLITYSLIIGLAMTIIGIRLRR